MSEYQYHEYQAVDMVLTPEEQAAVDDFSSHIEVSSIRAVVTYDWSDFRLMFRFPIGLLDKADIEPRAIASQHFFPTGWGK
jgi:hypothetical protein